MGKRRKGFQENLFDLSRVQELRRVVQELDDEISRSMKAKDFQRAKSLTKQQEEAIQELVAIGDEEINH